MSPEEARLILGVSKGADEEEVIDAYEEAVFEQASFFMRRTFIPVLAKKRVEKLRQLGEAAAALGLDIESGSKRNGASIEWDADHGDLENLIRDYNRAQTRYKLELANVVQAEKAMKTYEQWIDSFDQYAHRFIELYSGGADPADSVKLSDAPIFDAYAASDREVRSELEKKEYLRLKRLKG